MSRRSLLLVCLINAVVSTTAVLLIGSFFKGKLEANEYITAISIGLSGAFTTFILFRKRPIKPCS